MSVPAGLRLNSDVTNIALLIDNFVLAHGRRRGTRRRRCFIGRAGLVVGKAALLTGLLLLLLLLPLLLLSFPRGLSRHFRLVLVSV